MSGYMGVLMDGWFFWHFDFLLEPPQPVTRLFFGDLILHLIRMEIDVAMCDKSLITKFTFLPYETIVLYQYNQRKLPKTM